MSNRSEKMLKTLPPFIRKSTVIQEILNAEAVEFDECADEIEDLKLQDSIETATWSLPIWEKEYNTTPAADQPIEQRRAIVSSKMRGYGKFSGKLLKDVAEAYVNGLVDVSFNAPTSTFTIRFISALGIPPNIDDLKRTVDDIVPAHLLVSYNYRYLMLSEVEAMTLQQIENTTIDKLAWG
ncbi:putative phage tail protein [Paenibacillus gansuensis]|uniref:Phage tail protein n=1 Tax=Paenibacillus gansuensis TaxID=306542 RepID=A0ABW5PGQ6_9BACL